MIRFGYHWLTAEEACKKLGLAQGCIDTLSPAKRESLGGLDGMFRADILLGVLLPDKRTQYCSFCINPIGDKPVKGCCSQECADLKKRRVNEPIRQTKLEVPVSVEFAGHLVADAHEIGMPLQEFLETAWEYGRHLVKKFHRTSHGG